MTFMSHPPRTSLHLPIALAIGFTGHRKLPDEAKCREAIRKVLLEWIEKVPGVVYGVTSAAAGGDLLFAETCIELNLPIRVFLPLPKEQFREDFDEPAWARAECVFEKALSVEVTGAGEKLTERYYECGIETVQQSQLLIALWDGEPSQGLGGTADMVHFAKEQGRPVIWIHSATGAVQQFNVSPEILNDPEMRFLNGLPGPAVPMPAGFPRDLANAWFVKLDENASRVAPQFRRMAAIPIFCTAAAAVLSGKTALYRQQRGLAVDGNGAGSHGRLAANGPEAGSPPGCLDEDANRRGNLPVVPGALADAGALRGRWAGGCARSGRDADLAEFSENVGSRGARETISTNSSGSTEASGCSIRSPIFRATQITRPRGRADTGLSPGPARFLPQGSTSGCCSTRMA